MIRLEMDIMRALSRPGEGRLSASERRTLDQAASQGCFLLVDSLDAELVTDVHSALHSLFGLPLEVKQQYQVNKTVNPLGTGFSPYGVSKALDTGLPNLLETWDIGRPGEYWPAGMDAEWKLLKRYERVLFDLASEALAFMEVFINASTGDLTSLVSPANGGIHLIHYFPFQFEHRDGRRRQSEHCDNTLITLIPPALPTDSEISIYDRAVNTWEHVSIAHNECLVQAGLLLERVTGDQVRANLHTVRNPDIGSAKNVDRISTPFFLSPGPEVMVRLLPSCASPAAQVKYPDVSVHELQRAYFARVFSR
jgi:isopenicillin N synthase-like dioxygenase